MKINIKEIVVGDVFSEESHYIVEEIDKDTIKFKHTESGKSVTLGYGYVQDLLNTSDQYDKEVKVTKEDKKDGTPGIRTTLRVLNLLRYLLLCSKSRIKLRPRSNMKLKGKHKDKRL